MANSPTFGQFLLHEALPSDISFDGPVTKKDLQKEMSAYAKRDPQGYVRTVQRLKKLGDEVSTWEGLSVGLDDIQPDYKRRDPVLRDALSRVKGATTDAQRRKVITDAEKRVLDLTPSHPSDMTLMAKSGGRGSMAQLMKTVASPVATQAPDGSVAPWLITKSYAEGLNPADAWLAGANARRNVITSSGAVVEPGAVAKVITTNMQNLVVTQLDCGTTEGMSLSISDQVQDRYLAHAAGGFQPNTLLTPGVLNQLRKKKVKTLVVRSPMTCEVDDGVCQRCMGLNEWGKDPVIGMNVGMRSAQALTEPLTQFALNARHGVRLAGGPGDNKLRGLKGFQVLTEIPQSFTQRAALAATSGKVEQIERAPQGGWHLTVGGKQYYSAPLLKPIVRVGQRVEAGDALTEGVAMPDEVVAHKGIGEGRRYLSHQLTDLYRRQGVDIDRRHTELLARNAVNYVRIQDDPSGNFIPGDVVKFNHVKKALRGQGEVVPVGRARGRILAGPSLHFSAGTHVTPSVVDTLKQEGVKEVSVAKGGPSFEPVMKSVIRTPLLDDDWMGRLAHRYLKKTLVEGAGFGLTSNISSTNPVGAYAMGGAFGLGPDGKYAASEAPEPEERIVFPGTIDNYEEREKGAESTHTKTMPGGEKLDVWKLVQALEALGDEGLVTIPLESLSPSRSTRSGFSPKRMEAADTSYPLIVDEEGALLDGRHRALKLLEQGVTEAQARRASLNDIQNALVGESGELVDIAKQLGPAPSEKTAAFGHARRVLFGGGEEAFKKLKGPKLIGRWGGMDPEAHEARKIWGWMPEATRQRLEASGRGFFDEGELTRAGGERYRAIEDLLPLVRQRTGDLDPSEAARLQRAGLGDITSEDIAAIERARGGTGARVGRGLREITFGEAPLEMLRQRYRVGGVLGPGGVILGDIGISPATRRAVQDVMDPREMPWKERGRAGMRAAFYGGGETLDKLLSYGMPAYAMYEMAAHPETVEGQRGAAMGQTLGDVLGWSAGSPFGMVGGTAIAGTITELAKRLGHKFDPPSELPPGRLSSPWHDQAQQRYADALRSHRYSQYYDLAKDAGGQALDYGQNAFRPGVAAQPRVPHRSQRASPAAPPPAVPGMGPIPRY